MLSLRAAHRTFARAVATGATAAVAAAMAVTLVPTAAHAESTSSMESQFISLMNGARQSAGLRPYAVASDLTSIARQHSSDMARKNELYHNPSLTSQVQNWQAVGENVGEGPTVSDIHSAFMHSPEHRANILDHDFTQVGVGVSVDGNGTVWVTEDFRQPMHSTSTQAQPTRRSTTTTSRPTAHRSAAVVHHSARPTAHPATARPTAPAARHPVAHQSPRAQLLARLTALRTAAAGTPASDPVTAALTYLDAVTTLTSTG